MACIGYPQQIHIEFEKKKETSVYKWTEDNVAVSRTVHRARNNDGVGARPPRPCYIRSLLTTCVDVWSEVGGSRFALEHATSPKHTNREALCNVVSSNTMCVTTVANWKGRPC